VTTQSFSTPKEISDYATHPLSWHCSRPPSPPQQFANGTEDSRTLARYAWPYLDALDVALIDLPHVLVVLQQKVPARAIPLVLRRLPP
jgi:hypothetical protein